MHVWVQLSTKDIASNALPYKKVGKKLIQSCSKNFVQARLLLYTIMLQKFQSQRNQMKSWKILWKKLQYRVVKSLDLTVRKISHLLLLVLQLPRQVAASNATSPTLRMWMPC